MCCEHKAQEPSRAQGAGAITDTVSLTRALFLVVLASSGPAVAQAPPPTVAPATTPATPAQVEAIAGLRPHAERACRALYVRPDDARTCVGRVLDAALPLSLEDAERPSATPAPPIGGRGTTVAPDGRE